jgi:CheY-like chemotaxis protein
MSSEQRYTILYIEDNEANRQLVEMIIARRPELTLIMAEDGAAGLAAADTYQPQLILLDISLPDMDGHEVLARLKENERTATIPVFALSGNIMFDNTPGLPAFDGFLGKPIDINKFYAVIDKALRN